MIVLLNAYCVPGPPDQVCETQALEFKTCPSVLMWTQPVVIETRGVTGMSIKSEIIAINKMSYTCQGNTYFSSWEDYRQH